MQKCIFLYAITIKPILPGAYQQITIYILKQSLNIHRFGYVPSTILPSHQSQCILHFIIISHSTDVPQINPVLFCYMNFIQPLFADSIQLQFFHLPCPFIKHTESLVSPNPKPVRIIFFHTKHIIINQKTRGIKI